MNPVKKTRIKRIMSYFLPNRFSPRTEEDVQRWIIEKNNAETKKETSREFWDTLQMETDQESFEALERFNAKRNLPTGKPKTAYPFTTRQIAAILIVALVGSGGYFYYNHTRQQTILYTAGLGETKTVNLPDGTQVWINAGSTIEYFQTSKDSERKVYLDGEAYFNVLPDSSNPFIVETGNLLVKVLGTRFNVKAYSGESFATAILDKGQIEINTGSTDSYLLKPNELLRYNIAEGEVLISTVSDGDATEWMNGTLAFTNATLQEILNTIERRFRVTIDAGNISSEKQQDITVKFKKNDTLNDVLDILTELLGGITHKIEGNHILLEEQ